MDDREDLNSMLPFLPVVLRSSSLYWPPPVVEALKELSKGPLQSSVGSGEVLFTAISDIRSYFPHSSRLNPSAAHGYALFFDDLMPRTDAAKWFDKVLPRLADLLLRLPLLLEAHYQLADGGVIKGVRTGLRILDIQEPGIVFLSQELVAALLVCSFFCLFPTAKRGARHLPGINFDHLFAYVSSAAVSPLGL